MYIYISIDRQKFKHPSSALDDKNTFVSTNISNSSRKDIDTTNNVSTNINQNNLNLKT
jgi:hypothetical protein